jgi:hypothetical protein
MKIGKTKAQSEQEALPKSSSYNKLSGLSAISRIQGSVTKADLSQKSKESINNLKEKGAELKKALLENSSFLSGLTSKNDNKNSVNRSIGGNASGGGYKDLILSVLKKKAPAPV